MAIATTSIPLSRADVATRVEYLRRVALLTVGGLFLAAVVSTLAAGMIAVTPILQGRGASMIGILGAFAIANYVAPRMVFSETASTRWIGFLVGIGAEGVAMGWLLLAAFAVGAAAYGNPLALVVQAMGLVALTAVGMLVYLWTRPRELSLIRAGLAMLSLPMLVLMVLLFVFPVGGIVGIGLSALFVLISAGGLLYQTNEVLHRMRTDMHVEGAFTMTLGLLVLFWNILVLLMRLTDRR